MTDSPAWMTGNQLSPRSRLQLTPADVRNKQFSTTRLRPGYAEEEVDTFLDDVEIELESLIGEIGQLRRDLASGYQAPAPGSSPDGSRAGAAPGNPDAASRLLEFAQQTADQAIASAQQEKDEVLEHARQEAARITIQARQEAERVTSDARARADRLELDAREHHDQAMGSLTTEREELQQAVKDLRALEAGYRSRLREYCDAMLRDLENPPGDLS